MKHPYFLERLLLPAALLLAAASAAAQRPAPDSVARHPPTLLVKAGLQLTHLRYTHDSRTWQLLLPLSFGAEYRVASRLSCYTQFETDLQTRSATGRRRGQRDAVSAATLALGARYYYGGGKVAPRFGRYLALEGCTDWVRATGSLAPAGRRAQPTVLTPGVFVLWGVQHYYRPHVLYDLSVGAGVLAPAYYSFERPPGTSHWDAGAQLNLRLYFAN